MSDNRTTPLHRAALRWCAAKDREAEIRRGIPACVRDCEAADVGEHNFGRSQCCQAYVHVPPDGSEPLPRERWCPACVVAHPLLVELGRVRRQLGGYARAMRQAARKADMRGEP